MASPTTPSPSLPVRVAIPDSAIGFGFRAGPRGTHTSRTMMLAELRTLIANVPSDATPADYVRAVRVDNLAGKRTASNREHTAQRLAELYALDPHVTIFRVLRRLWDLDPDGQPLLALLCALARDPLLRTTAPALLALAPGDEFPRQAVADALRSDVGARLADATVDKVVRNTASTWTQSGHLRGRVFKKRVRVQPTPVSVAYALVLGFLLGLRGPRLLRTLWTDVLDATEDALLARARDAKRLGVLDLQHAGDVTEVRFPELLTRQELELSRGTD